MSGYYVLYLNDDNRQLRQGYYRHFVDAQRNRDDLIYQGFEAWIEGAEEPRNV